MDPGELDAAILDDAWFPGDLGYESRETPAAGSPEEGDSKGGEQEK